jgi:hypothetical protein
MNTYHLTIFNHSGSILVEQEMQSNFLPRVGEIIAFNKELDNTKEFIVTEVTFRETSTATFTPHLQCESFYKTGGYTRLWHLQQNYLVPGHCDDIDETER